MEGERILRAVKNASTDGLCADIRNYLGPVLSSTVGHHTETLDHARAAKYELFSLKLLKVCVEQLQQSGCRGSHTALLEAGTVCFEALQLCGCSGQAPPLSCETMLLHFASQCFGHCELSLGLSVCEALRERLPPHGGGGKDGEAILKHAYDILWKAALKSEQRGGVTLDSARLCLRVRQAAFQCLLATRCEVAPTLERVVRATLQFQKVALSASEGEQLSGSALNDLHTFHTALLLEKDLLATVAPSDSCRNFSPCLNYLLHLAKLHVQLARLEGTGSGLAGDAAGHLERLRTLTSTHAVRCSEMGHIGYAVSGQLLQLALVLRAGEDTDLLFLRAASELEAIADCHSLTVCALGGLADSVELLVSVVKEENCGGGNLSPAAVSSLVTMVIAHSQLVDQQLKIQLKTSGAGNGKALEQNGRLRQLSLLSFSSQLLREEDGDEIETLRGGASPTVSVDQPEQQPLATLCLPLLEAWGRVLRSATKGVLGAEEHRWLGNEAYNAGLLLFRREHYREAAAAVATACRELGVWCGEGEEREGRVVEASLLKRYSLLVECHTKEGAGLAALAAVEEALSSLPANQLAQPECHALLAQCWAKAKRACTGVSLGGRSMLTALRRRGHLSGATIAACMEAELSAYKAQGGVALQRDQCAVLYQLRKIYSQEEGEGGRGGGGEGRDCETVRLSWVLTELAVVLRAGHGGEATKEEKADQSDDESSLALLDEALSTIHPLTSRPLPPSQGCHAHSQAASAHLWRAVCQREQQARCVSAGEVEKEKGCGLEGAQEGAMLTCREETFRSLRCAVEGWEGAWHERQRAGATSLDACFLDVAASYQQMQLTASLCQLHSQPILALRVVTVMVGLYQCEPRPPSQLTALYQHALARHNELSLALPGGGGRAALRLPGASRGDSGGERRDEVELQASCLSHQLSLARWQLRTGEVEESRRLLLEVLRHPALSRRLPSTYALAAHARTLAADLLLACHTPCKPTDEFFQFLLTEPFRLPEACVFSLTPLELVADTARVFQGLVVSQDVWGGVAGGDHAPRAGAGVSAWEVVAGLLSSLERLARACLEAGSTREAYYYAREGVMAAKRMLLQGWYVKFLLLTATVQRTRGNADSALILLLQAARLLGMEDYLSSSSPHPLTPPPASSPHPLTPSPASSPHTLTLPPRAARAATRRRRPVELDSDSDDLESGFSCLSLSDRPPPTPHATPPTPHPRQCPCSTCTSPALFLLTPSLLMEWVALRGEVGRGEGVTGGEALLQILSAAEQLLVGGVAEIDEALRQCLQAGPSGASPGTEEEVGVASRGRRKEGKRKGGRQPKKRTTAAPPSRLSVSDLSISRSLEFQQLAFGLRALGAELRLVLGQTERALADSSSAAEDLSLSLTPPLFTTLARLHLVAAMATIGSVESSSPALLAVSPSAHFSPSPPHGPPTLPAPLSPALARLVVGYQLCFPACPALLLRDLGQWLGLLLTPGHAELAWHFSALSSAVPGNLAAAIAIGKRLRKTQPLPSPLSDVIATLDPRQPLPHPSPPHQPLRSARTLLSTSSPPPLAFSRHLLASLPPHWVLCGLSLAPKATPTSPDSLLISRARSGEGVVVVSVALEIESLVQLGAFEALLSASGASMALTEKRAWWATRSRLDSQLKGLLQQLQDSWLGIWRALLHGRQSIQSETTQSSRAKSGRSNRSRRGQSKCSSATALSRSVSDELEGCGVSASWRAVLAGSAEVMEEEETRLLLQCVTCGALSEARCEQIAALLHSSPSPSEAPPHLVLFLGRHLQQLPWESTPHLAPRPASRMPSLPFTAAHWHLLGHGEAWQGGERQGGAVLVDSHSTFYVLNPRGDLPNTEKRFGQWFGGEDGWEGVVGRAPTGAEFSAALQDHKLFIYCGHGTGCQYLHTDKFQTLDCHASALLMGCSSAKLLVGGRNSASGTPFHYLSAGCPALVGTLWDVTDADIDRYCRALLETWLSHSRADLPQAAAHSRVSCRFVSLTGAAVVLYGVPASVC